MEEQRPLALALLVSKVHVVQPPCGGHTGHFGCGFLLPVKPPEVDALLLQRMENQIHVIDGELLVGNVEGHIFLRRRVDAHGRGHGGVRLLPRLNARGRMQVQCRLQAIGVQACQELMRVRKEQLVPGIASPAQSFAGLIHFARGLELLRADVPAHVDDQHVQRHIVFMEASHQFVEFLIAVVPVARPPRPEGKPRRQRDAPGYAHIVAQRLAVVVAVTEEVPVLPLAGLPLDDPRPGTLFSVLEAEVGRVEERPGRVVHQRPAGARNQTQLDWLLRL